MGDQLGRLIDGGRGEPQSVLFNDQLAPNQFTKFGAIHTGGVWRSKPTFNKYTYEPVIGQRVDLLAPHDASTVNPHVVAE